MTRWARANNVHKQRPAEATPWSQLKASRGGAGKHGSSGSPACNKQKPHNDHLRRTQPGGSAVKKPNRKKKEYVDEDVNGFLEYLQQTGQSLPKGERRGSEEEQQFKEELETALKKDRRREDRRLKRQNVKKKNMVCTEHAHISDPTTFLWFFVASLWHVHHLPFLFQLCFNCRKPGHGLADCPEADRDEEMGRGICYRCGSTEHEIQKCKAKVDPALGEDQFEAYRMKGFLYVCALLMS